MNKLSNVILSILLMSGESVAINDITEKLYVMRADIDNAITDIKKMYGKENGIHLLHFNDKIQLATNPDYAEEIASVLNPIKERQLSKTALETAAIIAYKQPVTRLEIEEIRGVNSDYALQLLLKHSLITVIGRKDTIGKPLLFGTTDEFLKRFDLTSISQLPDYDELLNRIKLIRENENKDDSLYNNFVIPEEEQVVDYVVTQSGKGKLPEDSEVCKTDTEESDIITA
ncbi:MAG: SMC-Scp complex subunit ScpB [Clostridia bacterium]|nr:SMC-Scp complex subunit ScpB [Clostridia bacterium]MDD4275978.1 SMC-Scp complex subunit ScpB [Clostridia bacterium]